MVKTTSDTRKQIWKFQEGAVVLAARQVLGKADHVHWDHIPKGMSIDPDVVIGKDPDNPEIVIFVTHASAEMAGQKKFWRTVAEAIEAKRLYSHPKIISILFPGNVKPALKEIYKNLFDAVLHLDDVPYGEVFSKSLDTLSKTHGVKGKDICLSELKNESDKGNVSKYKEFENDIKLILKAKNGPMHSVMASPAFSGKERMPKARLTTLRRSVCKLYTLPKDVRDALLDKKSITSVPQHAFLLGWFQEDLAGEPELVDHELIAYLSSAKKCDVEAICNSINENLPSFQQYTETLNSIGKSKYYNKWIIDHFNDLITLKGMEEALDLIFHDPQKPLNELTDEQLSINSHWLFQTLMSVLRTETGRSDGYGYSVLGRETGRISDINAFAGTTIAPFITRKKALDSDLRKDIARVLAGHLKRLGDKKTEKLLEESALTSAQSIFRFQMMNYRFYNPIDWLVCDHLKNEKIKYDCPAHHDSFLSSKKGAVASRTGNLINVDSGRVWIKCQSAYAGKIDKRKELCGRVGAMKLCYTEKELEKKKFFLIIDGSFDDEDIRLFTQAGWNGVYYYDELDSLIKDVKKQL